MASRLARDRHTHEAPPGLALEVQVLPNEMSILGSLLHFFHGVPLALVLREKIVDRLSVGWGDGALLDEVVLLYNRVGVLRSVLGLIILLMSAKMSDHSDNSRPKALQCSCGDDPSAPGS